MIKTLKFFKKAKKKYVKIFELFSTYLLKMSAILY